MNKVEKLSHYAVVVIALTAVVVSVWQSKISQKQLELTIQHNRLTVQPYIDITRFTDSNKGTLEILLTNQGYGPAIVKEFELSYEGKVYDNWNAVLNAAGETGNIRFLRNYAEDSPIAPEREDVICRLETSIQGTKGITIKMVYESIYREKSEIEFTF